MTLSNPAHRKDAHAVGGRIKYYRERKGKDQKEIAEKIGVTSNAISNWENGRTRPDFSVVPKLCEALGITLYELYGIESKQETYTDKEKPMIERYRRLSHPHQLAMDGLLSSLEAAETVGSFPEIIKLICCDKGLAAGFDSGAEFEDNGASVYLYPNKIQRFGRLTLCFLSTATLWNLSIMTETLFLWRNIRAVRNCNTARSALS